MIPLILKSRYLRIFNFGCRYVFIRRYSVSSKNTGLNEFLLKMSRDRKHVEEAQQQRLKIKEKNSKYIPGTVCLQVLGSGAPGSPASVYLFTDQNRYLFNCGEGTQRLAHEHKTKLTRLENIFLTRTSWDHVGGLPGLSLTVQDAGVPNLTLFGPPRLDEIFHGMKRFVVLKHLKVQTINCEDNYEFDDQVMNIKCVPLKKKLKNSSFENINTKYEIEEDNTNYYENENPNANTGTSSFIRDFSKKEESVVMSYICKLKPKPGSLSLEKCVEKGVPPGPLLGELKRGIDITLDNGIKVLAKDVCAPEDPGPVFIFIDIPNENYLEALENANIFTMYQSTASCDENLAAVVIHFTPQNIIETNIYKKFIANFSPSTKHLILNSKNWFSGYLAAHRIQWQLNQMNECIFPILKESPHGDSFSANSSKRRKLSTEVQNRKSNENIENEENYSTRNRFCNVEYVNSLTTYHLRPRKGLDRSNEPKLNPEEYVEEIHSVDGFTESLNSLKIKLSEILPPNHNSLRVKEFPKITFLGTGSCIPNKTRNVSSILLHTNKNSCMLLDCGEGTWGQIIRFYGLDEARKILKKLKAVYISHLHADHHIGLMGIIKARQSLLPDTVLDPFILLAPKQITSWLYFYNQRIEPIIDDFCLIPNSDAMLEPLGHVKLHKMGVHRISTCLVKHCPHAFGIALETFDINEENIVKITYSGDTMPTEDLVEIGKNSSLLIHEATMEDELISEARYKMHSTVSQAIEQGKKMNAKYTILTHFSQRYAKLPRIEEFHYNNVGIAFDNMEVSLTDVQQLSLLYPTLKLMFVDHWEEMEAKALKRAFKKERRKSMCETLKKSQL